MQRTGLFLGAGASVDLGQPLVWQLTKELKEYLTPEKLKLAPLDTKAYDAISGMFARDDVHYESIVGFLEAQSSRPGGVQYGHFKDNILSLISGILYYKHVNHRDLIEGKISTLAGIASLAEANQPLWIFTLNHDLIIECLAVKYSIPLSAGLVEKSSLPRRRFGQIVGAVPVQLLRRLPGKPFEMQFIPSGCRGINLVKIHGSLDIFLQKDKTEMVRLLPLQPTIAGVIESLRATNEEVVLNMPLPLQIGPANERMYTDAHGEIQFLRRSILSGAFKFRPVGQQVMPTELLNVFKSYLNQVEKLIALGYGFGDDHINEAIRSWLEFADYRRLIIVSPGATKVPPNLLHLAPQVVTRAESATDYLRKIEGGEAD